MQSQAAAFERFPNEILLQITTEVSDLRSLYALVLAVPKVYRLLERHGGEILQAITSQRSITTPHVQDLIYLVLHARTNTWPPNWSLAMFLERFIRPTCSSILRRPEISVPLPRSKSLQLSLLAVAARIHHHTQLCLDHYRKRLDGVRSRLQRPADPDFNYHSAYGPYQEMVPGYQRKCEGIPYDTSPVGPPSWCEEQLVLLAMWQIQLFRELKHATLNGQLGESWSPILSMRLNDFFDFENLQRPNVRFQQVLVVHEFLETLTSNNEVFGAVAEPRPIPMHELWGEATSNIRTWSYDPRRVVNLSHHLNVVSLVMDQQSPLKGTTLALFRRMGFPLWDRERLASLGLADPPPPPESTEWRVLREAHRTRGLTKEETRRMCNLSLRRAKESPSKPHQHYWFAWRSTLSVEELAVEEQRLESEWQQSQAAIPEADQEEMRQYRERLAEYYANGGQ